MQPANRSTFGALFVILTIGCGHAGLAPNADPGVAEASSSLHTCGNPALALDRAAATKQLAISNAQVAITVYRLNSEEVSDRNAVVLSVAQQRQFVRLIEDPTSHSDCPGVKSGVCQGVRIELRYDNRMSTSMYCPWTGTIHGNGPDALDVALSSIGVERIQEFFSSLLG